jgi:hypothetical protein
MTRAVVNLGDSNVKMLGTHVPNQGPVVVVLQQTLGPSTAAPPSTNKPADTPTVSGDVIVTGETTRASYLTDLLSGAGSKDPTLSLLMLKQRLANDGAMQEALSNTMTAYHRMAMAVIGNMKA